MNELRIKRRATEAPVTTLVVQVPAYSSASSTTSTTKRRKTEKVTPAIYRLLETLPSPTVSRSSTAVNNNNKLDPSIPSVVVSRAESRDGGVAGDSESESGGQKNQEGGRVIRRPVSKRSLLSLASGSGSGTTTPPAAAAALASAETRRFHVARRIESGPMGRRSAVLREGERKRKRAGDGGGVVGGQQEIHRRLEELRAEGVGSGAVEKERERKRPHVHPKEHKQWAEKKGFEKSEAGQGKDVKEDSTAEKGKEAVTESSAKSKESAQDKKPEDEFIISDELESMVLDYLKSHPTSISSLPPSKPGPHPILGGGLGGGSWTAIDNQQNVEMSDYDGFSSEEDEDGSKYVYDVYKRETTPAVEDMMDVDVDMETVVAEKNARGEGEWGVVVLEDSDEEDFFLNAGEDGESEDEGWGSEDEDSNAEEYYKNEYPDEPSDFSDDGFDDLHHSDEENDDDYDDLGGSSLRRPWESWKSTQARRRTTADDEEYDFDEFDSDEDDKPRIPKGMPGLPPSMASSRKGGRI